MATGLLLPTNILSLLLIVDIEILYREHRQVMMRYDVRLRIVAITIGIKNSLPYGSIQDIKKTIKKTLRE